MPTVMRPEDSFVEERTTANATLAVLVAVLVVGLAILVGYFTWWAPAETQPTTIEQQTNVAQTPSQPPTATNAKGRNGARGPSPETSNSSGGY